MTRRKTIYLRDQTAEIIGDTGEGDNLSQRIAAMLARYRAICQHLLPRFSKAEWSAICDANNGTGSDMMAVEGHLAPSMMWANVADSVGLSDKWKIDAADLVAKMQRLSPAELIAVQEACTRFWLHCDLETDDALRAAWVTCSG